MTESKYPRTSSKALAGHFKSAEAALGLIQKGKRPEGEGPFGESIELMTYQLAKVRNIDTQLLSEAIAVDKNLMAAFRDDIEDPTANDIIDALSLCAYGLLLGVYNDEDFRFLYRYSLRNLRSHQPVESWLRKGLVLLAATRRDKPDEILEEVRFWIQYLGAPLLSPLSFSESAKAIGVNLDEALSQEKYRLADALIRHPQYIREAVAGRPFLEAYENLKNWAPDVLLKETLQIDRAAAYEEVQESIESSMAVPEAIEIAKKTFRRARFQSHKEEVLPVRLQELPSPPPGDAIDPVIFELIPQKLRIGLLPSVAYSAKIKKIEIVFLGGPRIGRSGILIKTDTGGILMDFGLSVANHRIPEWVPELEMIDTVLVTHGHLDHLGGLPVLFNDYDGKWCSVGPTAGIAKMLLEDALKVGTPFPPRKHDKLDLISRYTSENIEKATRNHVQLEYGVSSEVSPGIVVTPTEACHIPGSAVYEVDIEGIKILYTGDFNIDKSVLFQGASLPTDSDYVIFDGTYWNREDFDREQVKEQLSSTISKHGPVVIPSFAVGRTQEVLMILEQLGICKNRKVWVTGLAERVTKFVGVQGHWQSLKKNKVHLDEDDVLVSGGGMMSGGLARYHFNEQRNNPSAAVILCGYLAPRTAGWNLLHGYEPHECKVEMARLSAHSSSTNLQEFVRACKGKRIMVHTPEAGKVKGVAIPDYKERIVIDV
jgi:putative mRNA 3-end processing factor